MRIKAKTSEGQIVIGETLGATSTVQDIKNELYQKGFTSVLIKAGFPPKPVVDTLSLTEANIKNGDCIIVEDLAAPPPTPLQPIQSKVLVREQKDDNSCLFRSIGYIFLRNEEAISELRQLVSQTILNDPNYSDAILGKDRIEYCKWIQKMDSWGGAIELAIFSEYFKTEITSIDVATGRMDRFGQGYSHRAYVMYSGIHYDAIALGGSRKDDDIVVFEADNVAIEEQVLALAKEWKVSRKFTDLANFTLRCGVCSIGLVGQKDAQGHAMKTGHTQFTEY